MRRSPGSFVRETLNRLSLLETGGVGFLIGLSMGFLLFLVGDRFGRGWAITGFLITAIAVYLAVRILNRPSFRWNYENLRKGVLAETRVGQLIEYAITAEDCAVAHGVTRACESGRYRSHRGHTGRYMGHRNEVSACTRKSLQRCTEPHRGKYESGARTGAHRDEGARLSGSCQSGPEKTA